MDTLINLLVAWLLFGEVITAATILGMGLAAMGVSFVVRSPAPRAGMPE